MFRKFIQVGLYSAGGWWWGEGGYIWSGVYIWDVNWVTCLGGVLTGFYGMIQIVYN